MITPAVSELLLSYLDDGMDYRLITEAIKIATLCNNRNAKYINGILKNWKNKNYKVLADIENEKKTTNKITVRNYEDSYLDSFYSN